MFAKIKNFIKSALSFDFDIEIGDMTEWIDVPQLEEISETTELLKKAEYRRCLTLLHTHRPLEASRLHVGQALAKNVNWMATTISHHYVDYHFANQLYSKMFPELTGQAQRDEYQRCLEILHERNPGEIRISVAGSMLRDALLWIESPLRRDRLDWQLAGEIGRELEPQPVEEDYDYDEEMSRLDADHPDYDGEEDVDEDDDEDVDLEYELPDFESNKVFTIERDCVGIVSKYAERLTRAKMEAAEALAWKIMQGEKLSKADQKTHTKVLLLESFRLPIGEYHGYRPLMHENHWRLFTAAIVFHYLPRGWNAVFENLPSSENQSILAV